MPQPTLILLDRLSQRVSFHDVPTRRYPYGENRQDAGRPLPYKVPDRVIRTLAKFVAPSDLQWVLPLINRDFYAVVRSAPRVVLLKIVLSSFASGGHIAVAPSDAVGSEDAAQSSDPTGAGEPTALDAVQLHGKIAKPLLTTSFCALPAESVQITGAHRSCEAATVLVDFKSVPDTSMGLTMLIQNLHQVLRKMLPTAEAQGQIFSKRTRTDELTPGCMFLLPWEVTFQVPPDAHQNFADQQHLFRVLNLLNPPVVNISNPPPAVFKILPKNLRVCRITGIAAKLDFAPLANLQKLSMLHLDGHVEHALDELIVPSDLAPITHLPLRELALGRWLPLSDYGQLCEAVLAKLDGLLSLTIRGLFQGDQTPQLLADTVSALKSLVYLDRLVDVDDEFWDIFDTREPNRSITTITVELSEAPIQGFRSLLNGFYKAFPNVTVVRVQFRDLEESEGEAHDSMTLEILSALEGFREHHSTAVRMFRLEGLQPGADALVRWLAFNSYEGTGKHFRLSLGR
ncbi:uncharacterized protein BJ171DRAFT_51616 [Polychytrium aggregatum]|uniref:uncharacterized protein n=1 Tax=Polychytrium aggregatum TaxID=110093 RepID=UPI0022FDF26F|nr:uncharacterized protein BJ171DRAFT_51616 [Polychytrium aggregatum]KAI9205755.1 hypothetical protein BJ171DRAFT_51616 [Polychytrium aggregatum]